MTIIQQLIKRLIHSALIFLSLINVASAQWAVNGSNMYNLNTGNVGIGTTTPVTALDVNGAISIKGYNINDTQLISVPTDGTYVIASGPRLKGTYTINFETAYRIQTVVLLANATQYDYASSLSILSNVSYGGSVVMSNFRYVVNPDNSVVYLIFDVSNRNSGNVVTAHFEGTGAYNAAWGGLLPTSPALAGVYPLVVNQGSVSIGTNDAKGYRLAVNGSGIATSITVKAYANWPDYVFRPNYKLPSLSDLKTYIGYNHHLPEMPPAKEVETNGQNLGEINTVLVKKVEELTLYLIGQDEKLKAQQRTNQFLQQQITYLMRQMKVKDLKPVKIR